MHALVLAGGLGTRLRPLTLTRPKPLVPFCGAPFAAGLVRRLADAGARRVTFLIGSDPAPFASLAPLADDVGVRVEAVTEERPLDTAGAARRLLRGIGDAPVLVCNGDVLTDLDLAALVAAHGQAGAAATIALTRVEDTSAFGVVECDAAGRVRRFVEKPAPGTAEADTVNAGTYVLAGDVFDAFAGDGPLSFEREVFPSLLERGAVVHGVVSASFWADLGTPERYLDGTMAVLDGRCAWPVASDMVAIGDRALVHRGARVQGEVGPGCVIGDGCVVASGARLERTVLFEQAVVGTGAFVEGSILGVGGRVPPGARLAAVVVGDGEVADG
jgi:mannose-1-phosphate guanylyltransferase